VLNKQEQASVNKLITAIVEGGSSVLTQAKQMFEFLMERDLLNQYFEWEQNKSIKGGTG